MTKQHIDIAVLLDSIFSKTRYLSIAVIAAFLAFSFSSFASSNADEASNSKINHTCVSTSQTGATFRGAELLAYSQQKGILTIKLQVYYSVFQHDVPETETVREITKKNTIGSVFELKKELELIDIKPIDPASGILPNPEDDCKTVIYTAQVDLDDEPGMLNLIWSFQKYAGLLNNISIKEDQKLSLHLSIDKLKLNPAGHSKFFGLFPYMVISDQYVDSTNWQVLQQFEYNSIALVSQVEEVLVLEPVTYNTGFSPDTPLSSAIKVNGMTKEIKVNKLTFGSYFVSFSIKEDLQSNSISHQAMYIITSRL